MTKLSIVEKMMACAQRGEALPLEGRTRITLTDVHTGKREMIEHKNDVTTAMSRILAANYMGASDYFSMLPLKQFFSGVLCFNQQIVGIPTNPPCQSDNALIAHAGDEAHATASTLRGNPNVGEQVITDNSIKQVWDWQTNQGNGTINTVCLCPNTLGNNGLMPMASAQFWMSGGNKVVTIPTEATARERAIMNPIEITSANECISIYINGTTFEEITSVHDYIKFGVIRSASDWTESSNRTATIRSFTSNKAMLAFDEDYYYVYEVTSGTAIKIDKIDRDDMSVTTADLSLSGTSLYYGGVQYSDGYVKFAFDGTYLYLPHSDKNKFYKVNISDASDVTLLNGTITTMNIFYGPDGSNSPCLQPIVISDGLILGETYLINGDTVYDATYPIQLNGTARGYGVGDDTRLSLAKADIATTGYPANY